MNKKILTLGLMLCAGLGAQAQVSLVNPVPQEVTVAGENSLIEAPAEWKINADKKRLSGYVYDALLTASPEVSAKAKFKVTFGVRGDSKVSKYKKLIPAKAVGYFLKGDSAHIGYKAKLWKVVTENGVEVSREQVNYSSYKMTPRSATVGVATSDPNVFNEMQAAIGTGSIDHVKNVIAILNGQNQPAATDPAAVDPGI